MTSTTNCGSATRFNSRVIKKKRKRKELDALVATSKTKKILIESDSSEVDDYKIENRTYHVKPQCLEFFRRCLGLCVCLFVITGIVVCCLISWLGVHVRYEVDKLEIRIKAVEIENENLPAELHGYHSSLQEILKNQTQFRDDLLNLSNKVESLSDQVLKIVAQLKSVESKVAKGPEPLSLQTLQTTVGNFGSHLTDLASAVKDIELNVKELGSQQQIMDNKLSQMKTNVTVALENCTSKEGHELMDQKIKIVNDALSSVNKSLSYQLQETNTEVHKHHDSISDLNNRLVVVGRSLNITTNKLDQISQSQIP